MSTSKEIKSRITPSNYFTRERLDLRGNEAAKWITVNCTFHSEATPSMSINLDTGGFVCHACGAKGGDIIAFEMQRYGLTFKDAVTKLTQEWGLE
jgi:DNA primase